MGLRAIESKLPPGFRFCPSDEELVFHYLYKKVTNQRVSEGTLMDVDLHTCEPSQLPDAAKLNETEWYFFSFRDRKYSTGFRTNRATREGYWKATGKDRAVHEPSRRPLVGMRKTLVFYRGRAPNGAKSGWVMHEFRLENPYEPPKEDFVLCRVFHKMKGETRRCGGLENEQNNNNVAGTSFSLSMASPFPLLRIDGGIAEGYGQQLAINCPHVPVYHHGREGTCSANGLLSTAVWHYGFLDLTQETNSPAIDGGGEEYRYFLDMDQEPEDHDLRHEQLGRNESVP